MTGLDTGVLLVFSAVVVLAGAMFARTASSMTSFFAAGGAVPWWISGLSLFMSFFSVGTFVVWGSIAYGSGLVAVAIQMTMCAAGVIVGVWFAPRWNATGVLTVAQYISERLGKRVQYWYSVLFLLVSLFTAGAFLYPIGKIVEVATGIPLQWCILAIGGLVIAYTAVGGLWAVLVTDVLQFVVLSAAVVILVPVSLQTVGGWETFVSRAPAGFFAVTNAEYGAAFLIGFCIYNAVFIGGNWAYVQRYTSVGSPRDARRVGLLFALLYLVAPIVWMLPPMIYRVIAPEAATVDHEGAYLLIAREVLPAGLVGLVIGGMVFATASSVNSTLNICAGVFTNDILATGTRLASGRKIAVARGATIVAGVLALSVALLVESMGGIVSVVLGLAAITGAAMYLPPVWSMFSRYQTGFSSLFATVASLAVNLAVKFALPAVSGNTLSLGSEMLMGACLPIGILCAFECYYRARAHSAGVPSVRRGTGTAIAGSLPHDARPRTSAARANVRGIGVIAWGTLITALLIVLIGVAAERHGPLVILVGCCIAAAALALLVACRRLSAPAASGDMDA